MASTYSTNLGIELIGTGDQAGSWGTTTNTNLGTLIEQAISGYETQAITDGADTVITIPNGASGVARNMYIEMTGALTAARNLIVPANKKLYFIYNNTTGGYAVTVKVLGQTGVSVPNGLKVILVSNGTDIVSAVSSTGSITFDSTTISTASTNQNINITPNGTGRVFASGVAIGPGTGSGTSNTSVGAQAGDSMTTGDYNTFMGYNAGTAVTTGSRNVSVGYWSGDVFNHNYGTHVGWLSGSYDNGSANTAIGAGALGTTSGYGTCTAIGYQALSGIGSYTNCSGLGANTAVTGSNQVQIGDSSTTTYVYGTVQNRSDLRDKADVQDTDLGLNFIMALKPRKFRWDMRDDYKPPMPDRETATSEEMAAWQQACDLGNITHDGSKKRNRFHQGLIAQEVKETMDAMGVDFGGYQDHLVKDGQDVKSIGYNELIAPLIKAIQELKAEFDEYKRTHP